MSLLSLWNLSYNFETSPKLTVFAVTSHHLAGIQISLFTLQFGWQEGASGRACIMYNILHIDHPSSQTNAIFLQDSGKLQPSRQNPPTTSPSYKLISPSISSNPLTLNSLTLKTVCFCLLFFVLIFLFLLLVFSIYLIGSASTHKTVALHSNNLSSK